MKKVLLILHLTPLNFIPAFILSFFYKVIYWKPIGIPKLLRSLIEHADMSDYLDSDEWQIAAERASIFFEPTLKFWSRLESLNIKIANFEIDFLRQWIQWLAFRYEEHYRFLTFVEAFQNKMRNHSVYFAETFLRVHSKNFALQFPFYVKSIQWFGWIDTLWIRLVTWIATFRSLKQFLFKNRYISELSNPVSVRFVFAGISPSEFTSEKGKLDFSFLVQRELLKAEEALYVLPSVPSEKVRQYLKEKNVQWSLNDACLSSLSLGLRLRALTKLFSLLFNVKIKTNCHALLPVLKWMSVKSLPWVIFASNSKPDVYAASQSASWPEESAVSVMNSFGVRTVSWFYSTNSFGILKSQNPDFKDRSLENGIWISKEAWVWNQSSKNWLENRNMMPAKFPIQFSVYGPVMCGDYRYLNEERASNQKFKFISVYDVPALSGSALKELGLGPLMYTPEITNRFYQDLTDLLDQLPEIGLILKPKRPLTDQYREYPKSFWALVNTESPYMKQGRIVILPNDIDPYLAISSSRFFIGLPFTSPVLFGLQPNHQLLFHDPLNTFCTFFPKEIECLITRGKEKLIERIRGWLSKEERNLKNFEAHRVDWAEDPAICFANLLREGDVLFSQRREQSSILTANR